MLVRDVMSAEPVTVRSEAKIKDALALLSRYHLTSLPVVDEHQRLQGMVSEADLIRDALQRDPRLRETPYDADRIPAPQRVEEVYTPHAVTVRENDDLAEAVELMTTTSVKSLPVVDDRGRVIGVVSRSDVVRVLARADSAIETEVLAMLADLGHTSWLVEVDGGTVHVSGPTGTSEEKLARLAANSVPGVVDVRVE